MGSPISSATSEFFMQHLENRFISQNQNIMAYFKYVDDVFIVLKRETDLDDFKIWMNSWHKNIVFEKTESNSTSVHFLDIEILFDDIRFETKIYRKPQHPLKFTGFDSWTPFKFKANFVTTMLFRANRICSKVEFYDEEKKEFVKYALFKWISEKSCYQTVGKCSI